VPFLGRMSNKVDCLEHICFKVNIICLS